MSAKFISSLIDSLFFYIMNTREWISLLLFRSNHPRRFFFHKNLFLKKFKKYQTLEEKNNNLFYLYKDCIESKHEDTLIIYIGDSITEYLSRVRSKKSGKYRNTLTLWLGPITRLGFLKDSDFKRTKIKLKITLKLLSLYNKKFSKKILVWSSGSIDVRCSIYDLLLSGSFKNEGELFQLYKRNTDYLLNNFLIPLKADLKICELVILSELNSNLIGECPSNLSEIKKIRLNNEFPTLGTFEQRLNWTKILNKITFDVSKQANVKFLDINKFVCNKELNQSQFDGVHLSDPIKIKEINNQILRMAQ